MSTAPARQGIPLRPDPAAIAERARRSLARASIASARASFQPDQNPHRILERDFLFDDGASLILKTARAPHSTADTAVLQQIVSAVVLGSAGAGVQLLQRGLVLSFGRAASISLPALIADASHASFVAEGAPIPVHESDIAAPAKLEPRTIKAIWAMTREMTDSPNAEALVEDCAKRSIGLALDSYLFDTNAGDTVRPAGLRHSVAPLTASAGTDAIEQMLADIKLLLTAVSPIGGPVTLVANTVRAQMMPAMARGGTLPPVLGSPAVAAGDLIAIATDALAAALSPEIEVTSSKGTTLHTDTAPQPIGTAGAPATVAAPTRNLFQTDSVAMRLRLGATWALRDQRAIAWLTTAW